MVLKSTIEQGQGQHIRNGKNPTYFEKKVYGLLFAKLDVIDNKETYIAAYGDVAKVQAYQKNCYLKGEVKEYKTQSWLVKRLESLKGQYEDDVTILFLG